VIVALLVTHNSERWIERTLESITSQTRPVDRIIMVDDRSTDETRRVSEHVPGSLLTLVDAHSTASDVTTRIAANFAQGLLMCAPDDIVVLGDHDDVWLPNRVEHQVEIMTLNPHCIMLASDGNLLDSAGERTGRRLRDVFPVASGFNQFSPVDQLRYALHSSVATGGACVVRPAGLRDALVPPPRWLHDRWWSIVALVQSGIMIDEKVVIDYRVQSEQVVGLDLGYQELSHVGRLGALARDGISSIRKTHEVSKLRKLAENPQMGRALSLPTLVSLGLRPAPTLD
jgi:glycosyltransferase involved in cell wall biosynthesis